jgi:hypothetical protein
VDYGQQQDGGLGYIGGQRVTAERDKIASERSDLERKGLAYSASWGKMGKDIIKWVSGHETAGATRKGCSNLSLMNSIPQPWSTI